ncbi:glycosyltransferase family 2 protein [Jannaschia sp. S6380]|uniref:glycosyltransferase family 2 protein n=1 Tax=Jannaschia sp. S6380 TaxID=2926408 RepID=UPI001FF4A39B|nr:glycosyltransferase family A protein [Jannaschia sp. S6380]MCK0168699.1 glycosyltransferase family 2 protein [Jannaschia sp. S6380]
MGERAVVIIPHRDDPVRLTRCLDALVPTLPGGVGVAVVDNGSRGDVAGLVARYPGVRLLREPLAGAANARNRGVAETEAPLLLFLDADCLPDPDWTETALRVADRGDLVTGEVYVFHETDGPATGAQAFEQVFAFDFRTYVARDGFAGTGNLVTRRAVFDDVGPFRAGMSEDKDWCQRARARGHSLIYVHELRVGHPSRADWSALARKWRRLTDEARELHRADGRPAWVWTLRALAMPASIVVHAPRVLRAPGLGAGEKARALATLARLRLARMVWMLGG